MLSISPTLFRKRSGRKLHLFLKPRTLGSLKWWHFNGECFEAPFLNLDFWESTPSNKYLRANNWVESQVQECWWWGGKVGRGNKRTSTWCVLPSKRPLRARRALSCYWRPPQSSRVCPSLERRSQSHWWRAISRDSDNYRQFVWFEARTCLRTTIKSSGGTEYVFSSHNCRAQGWV